MKMIKVLKSVLVVIVVCVIAVGCGAKKLSSTVEKKVQNPFGETFESPCQVYDTPQEFAATGIFRGSSRQMGEVQYQALLKAQEMIRLKMKHAYQGVVRNYSVAIGNNQGNDIELKMTSAGDHIFDQIINETTQSCTRWSEVEDDGHITCYIAIQIPKGDVAAKISKDVENKLTQEEKERIGFNEQEYRKEMARSFKGYKENH